jgi:hypothetical protein
MEKEKRKEHKHTVDKVLGSSTKGGKNGLVSTHFLVHHSDSKHWDILHYRIQPGT